MFVTLAGLAALLLAGCGSSSSQSADPNAPETNPPGDIPDNQAFVPFSPPRGGFSVKVPEGWSQTRTGQATTFTDKLNAIRIESRNAAGPLTMAQAAKTELPLLGRTVKGFTAGKVMSVRRRAGHAVELTYLAAAKPNQVTGKAGQDAVERYVFFHNGEDVVLTLSGPQGADNVDPWMLVSDSLKYTQ